MQRLGLKFAGTRGQPCRNAAHGKVRDNSFCVLRRNTAGNNISAKVAQRSRTVGGGVRLGVVERPLLDQTLEGIEVDVFEQLKMIAAEVFLVADGALGN